MKFVENFRKIKKGKNNNFYYYSYRIIIIF